MPTPRDPDTEDRRPDHEREPDNAASELDDDAAVEDRVVKRPHHLFEDEEDLVELALDDLREMEGPDA